MKNKSKEKAIDDLLGIEEENENTKKIQIMEERSGLIERIDRTLVDKSGRVLLREQY